MKNPPAVIQYQDLDGSFHDDKVPEGSIRLVAARKKPHVVKSDAPTFRPCAGCGTLLADCPDNFCSFCVGNV